MRDAPLTRLAALAVRRRGRIVVAWVAALVAVLALSSAFGGSFEADYATPGSDSKAAADVLAERFPGRSSDAVDVVWHAPAGADAPAVARRVDALLARADRLEGIGRAQPAEVSPDGTIAVARLQLEARDAEAVPVASGEALIRLAQEASRDGLRVELGGQAIRNAQSTEVGSETTGLVVAAVILLVTFGSLVAAGLPLVSALFGLGISSGLIALLTSVVEMPDWSTSVAAMIGIGVGIDYALLVLTRFRAGLAEGRETHAALVEAMTTAGRSVLVAGTTVVISLLGLFLVGFSYLQGVALAAIASVLVVMAASVTLLPALLAFAGRGVDRLRVPGVARGSRAARRGPAARWAAAVQRRPWTAAIAGTAVLLALATPVLGFRLGFPDAGNDPAGTTTRGAYDLASRGFGAGANGPLLLAAELPDREAAARLAPLADRLREVPGVAAVGEPALNARADTAVLAVVPESSPQSEATKALVRTLRDDVLPGSGVEVKVGGATAAGIDHGELTARRLPVFVGAVVALSFLLLVAAFRAPLIAVKAGILNLLSIAAAYGVVALVAEGGWAGRLIGIDTETPVPAFIPVMMFAIVFGLSMDYEVFLVSRVREEFLRHRDAARAVAEGVARTARVITAAAAIMVAVFAAFVLSDQVFLKMIGIGLAAAILVDATVVRLVLVPALMQLLGRHAWWMPRWLERLVPRVEVEAAPARP